MSFEACAELVQRADPDRFLCTMAADPEARAVLFPLYAFNIEVARSPWVTQEPMIAEMRLQWWRDALDEVAGDAPARRHEVVDALHFLQDGEVFGDLDALIEARRWDIYKEPFADEDAFWDYLDRTCANLLRVAGRHLGAPDSWPYFQQVGRVIGLARYLAAVPELEARGRVPLVDGRPEAVRTLAEKALGNCPSEAILRRDLPPLARACLIERALTRPVLEQVIRDPGRVANGALGLSPFSKRWRLLLP